MGEFNKWTEEEIAYVRQAAAEGRTTKEMSEHIGRRRPAAIQRFMHANGIPYIHHIKSQLEVERRTKQILDYLRQGMTYTQIAERMNVTRSMIAGYVYRINEDERIARPTKGSSHSSRSYDHLRGRFRAPVDVEKRPGAFAGNSRKVPDLDSLRAPLVVRLPSWGPPLEEVKYENEPESLKIAPEDLLNRHCRWVHGNPKQSHHYCGHTVKPGSSYCDFHHKICYIPGSEARAAGNANASMAASNGVRHVLR